jgi:HAD superfamily phosphoserine phosphatase-like hydrolase
MLELARFSSGNLLYLAGLSILSPWLIGMKLGVISRKKAKEKLLSYFFAGMPIHNFNELCMSFTEKKIPGLLKKEALEKIHFHLNKQATVVIVSASAENWVAPWCIKNNVQFICTKLDVENNKITGKLKGENCNGDEKVSQIIQRFNLADYSTIYCYGDTKGDKKMLALATHPYYKTFNN